MGRGFLELFPEHDSLHFFFWDEPPPDGWGGRFFPLLLCMGQNRPWYVSDMSCCNFGLGLVDYHGMQSII